MYYLKYMLYYQMGPSYLIYQYYQSYSRNHRAPSFLPSKKPKPDQTIVACSPKITPFHASVLIFQPLSLSVPFITTSPSK